MNATVQKFTRGIVGRALCAAGLSLVLGCSQQAEQKPEAANPKQSVEAKPQAPTAKTAPAARGQESSLEALQKGTLGKGSDQGPLADVYFDFDRYDLSPQARNILKRNATWLKANPRSKVEIEGHCDERGTSEYNLALGAKRAESAKRYLTDLGVSPSILSSISYGEELPVCKEENETCWAKNRRARFVVRTGPTS